MPEHFNQPPPGTPEKFSSKEGIEGLISMFIEAEKVFEAEGREGTKPLLIPLYATLQDLNGFDMSDWTKVWTWNPEGGLTEAEFNELNLRRKKLSNTTG